MKVLMAEVNISEGKDLDLVEQVKAALLDGEAVDVMDINSNANHNRTVFTYKGSPEAVLDGTKRLAAKAIELIDMTKHTGSHPRIGAVDVVPFIPVKDVSIDDAGRHKNAAEPGDIRFALAQFVGVKPFALDTVRRCAFP